MDEPGFLDRKNNNSMLISNKIPTAKHEGVVDQFTGNYFNTEGQFRNSYQAGTHVASNNNYFNQNQVDNFKI